jgi:hypothetical protein
MYETEVEDLNENCIFNYVLISWTTRLFFFEKTDTLIKASRKIGIILYLNEARLCDISAFHSDEDLGRDLVCCDAV